MTTVRPESPPQAVYRGARSHAVHARFLDSLNTKT